MKSSLQVIVLAWLMMAADVASADEPCVRVYFPFGGDTIVSPAQVRSLDQLLSKDQNLKAHYVVSGFTDAWATQEYNYSLASRRIDSVVSLMVAAGVPPRNIKTRAIGEMHPYLVATNKGKQNSDMARNRRVEVCRVKVR